MANSNKPPDGTPPAAEWGLLRAYLAKSGFSQQQINDAIGITVNGRSRLEIADDLRKWLFNLGG